MAAAIARNVREAARAQKLALEKFENDPDIGGSAFVEAGFKLIQAIKARDDFAAPRLEKFKAARRVFADLRNGDVRGIQNFCLKSPFNDLVQWGACMRDRGGVPVGKSATLCNKPVAAFLGVISILRDHGEALLVRYMEKQLRAWIRETPRAEWAQFLIHPVTRDVAVRLRVLDGVGLFSNLRQMRLGAVHTDRGSGKIASRKDDKFTVCLDGGGSIEVKRTAFYFDALPF
jgi:hypothetical protein